jgi:hypothetical protein
VLKWGISAEKEGGHTAKALIPAAFLGSKPHKIRVGISKKPGPTPRRPLKTDIGIARIVTNLKFSLTTFRALKGLKSL